MVTDAVDEFYNPQINSWWPRLGPSLVLESREEALQQSVSRQSLMFCTIQACLQ